jgi:protein-histidine pros-kinase
MSASKLPSRVVDELLHSAVDAAVVADREGRIIYLNREAENLFGYNPEELLGQTVEVLMPAEYREKHQEYRRAYRKAPRSRPLLSGLDLYARRKDGSHFRAEIALTPIRTDDGVLVASTVREVNATDESEAYFRTMLESAPDAMIIVDARGRIAIVNAKAEDMFGYSRQELLGHRIEMLLPERLRENHRAHRGSFSEKPELRPMGPDLDLVGRRKDGREFPVEISLSPVKTSSGAFVSSVIRDVTNRKRMEREIIAARQTAERAQKANTAFLAAASHDLRQPVQALSLLNGALRRTVKQDRALEMVESQEASLTAMTNLLNSLLDISRLDAGAVTPEIEDFPMQRVIDRLSAEFGRQASHKGLEFYSEPCAATVRSDPNLLSEIIQNLVSNAIRYTDNGNVHMSCDCRGDVCRLEVMDTGIGIEEDQLKATCGFAWPRDQRAVDTRQGFEFCRHCSGNSPQAKSYQIAIRRDARRSAGRRGHNRAHRGRRQCRQRLGAVAGSRGLLCRYRGFRAGSECNYRAPGHGTVAADFRFPPARRLDRCRGGDRNP